MSDAILAMTQTLAHRGPDDFGVWTDAAAGIALGHRRLSILDLSAAGKQPMLCAAGRYVIVYNGEIYNFEQLRDALIPLGHRFRGHSDTEVLLAAISEWGVDRALRLSNGMFAFALWDRMERTLTLARDRVGKKPLYYGKCGGTLMFGSELKALRALGEFDGEIDRDALGLFIQYGWVPGPRSIFKHISKLPAGTHVTLRAGADADAAIPQAFWSAGEAAERGQREPFAGSFADAVDALEDLLTDAVRCRMIADVPLGALLSGGIDSSSVVALMQSVSGRPVKTYAIGFDEAKYDEAPHAAAVARHLGTEHHALYVTGKDGLDIIPLLPTLYDEPFADPSQIPTFLVSRLARTGVTVALSGDGGDELFAGYSSYGEALAQWRKRPPLPLALRRGLAQGSETLARLAWRSGSALSQRNRRHTSPLAKLARRTALLTANTPVELFAMRKARATRARDFVLGTTAAPDGFRRSGEGASMLAPEQAMMEMDFACYLVDDVLVKVDRASMGVGLEVRCPLLDWRVVELAWSLPLPMRVEPEGGGKRVLKGVLERHVPRHLTDRPKSGFSVPIASWLSGPLRPWAEGLLSQRRMRDDGYLAPGAVRRAWEQHRSGWANHEQLLWNLLTFLAWREHDGAAAAPRGAAAARAAHGSARAAQP